MTDKDTQYSQAAERIRHLAAGETDAVAVMATVACELHHAFPAFTWTGFYRVTEPGMLTVGPYQGTHGCLRIPFDRGVCGKAAREGRTQVVPDVLAVPYHIACSSSTRAEIVVPVRNAEGAVRAVLDIDSDVPGTFDETDRRHLEAIVALMAGIV